MRKTLVTIAFLALLGTLAVSCQKESFNNETFMVEEQNAVYKVRYSIDGVTYQLTLVGEEAWRAFLNRMLALAEEGHIVSFRNENASSQIAPSKETITYTTSNHDDAYEWAAKMVNLGYNVTIIYDERTGKYICIAVI